VGGASAGRGENQLRLLRHWGLRPSSHVLEIGCGVGRLAYELASFLDADGRYTGFDVSPTAIDWCNEHYAARLPNFRFDLVEARNVRYNPQGGVNPASLRFPYADENFDVVCAFAVFMHMQLPERTRTRTSTSCARSPCSCTCSCPRSRTTGRRSGAC
jgi:SAM-dependent methyltransferase